MRQAYRGDISITEWLRGDSQGSLFYKDFALKRLIVIATRIVEDMGRETSFADLSEEIKKRAAGRMTYDSALVALALQSAMSVRQQ